MRAEAIIFDEQNKCRSVEFNISQVSLSSRVCRSTKLGIDVPSETSDVSIVRKLTERG